MADKLIIHLLEDHNNEAIWGILDNNGQYENPPVQSLLTDIPKSAKQLSTWVLVPGIKVLLTQASMVTTSPSKLIKAIPYALEEQLAEDVENLHFALGDNNDNLHDVAVVTHEDMQKWLATLELAEIKPQVMLPDTLTLPFADTWHLYANKKITWARTGKCHGFAIDTNIAPLLLDDQLSKKIDQPTSIMILSTMDTPPLTLTTNIPVTSKATNEPFLSLIKNNLTQPAAMNLLQGNYQSTYKLTGITRRWMLASILLICLILSLVLGQAVDYFRLNHQQRAQQQTIENLYKQVFNTSHIPSNPTLMLKRRIEQLTASLHGDAFLHTLHQSGKLLTGYPDITLRKIVFQNASLTIDLETEKLSSLQKLSESMKKNHLDVKQTTSRKGKMINAKLNIKEAV